MKLNITKQFLIKVEINDKNPEKAKTNLIQYLKAFGCKVLDIQNVKQSKTEKQNRALHLWFHLLAEALNDAGFDQKKVINIDIPWSAYSVKEYLWRPTQIKILGKKSTTRLARNEIDPIFEIISKTIGERCNGLYVPFPSIQTMEEQAIKNL
jgi:hypothetical protein